MQHWQARLQLLRIVGAKETTRALLATYACHCVVLSDNRISGDWAGYAAEQLRAATAALVGLRRRPLGLPALRPSARRAAIPLAAVA